MLFDLGDIVVTCGISWKVEEDPGFKARIVECLGRHASGDWGNLCEDDKALNDLAIRAEENGEATGRLFSAYGSGDEKIYIITEYDRSRTTILLPEEY